MSQDLTIDDKDFLTGIAKKIIELKLVTPFNIFSRDGKAIKFYWKSNNGVFWTNN